MNKDMNNLKKIITKYDIILTLFMSLIIVILFNYKDTIAFCVGILLSLLSFWFIYYTSDKLLEGKVFKHVIGTIVRIVVATFFAIPFIYRIDNIIFYLLGYTIHYIVVGYCILKKKGSA